MRRAVPAVLLAVFTVHASGLEGYVVPGVETGEVLINVHVWGEVVNPGTVQVPVGSDLVTAISAAGGPTGDADMGRVRLAGSLGESEFDLASFLDGDGPPPPVLEPGITVHVRRSTSDWWKEALDVAYKIIVAVNLVWIMTER